MRLKVFFRENYLDYVNNYLTIEKFAEDKGISITDAKAILKLGKKYHNQLCKLEK